MPEKKIRKKSIGPRKRRKLAGKSTELASTELLDGAAPKVVEDLQDAIDKDGGKVFTVYREPFGGHVDIGIAVLRELQERPQCGVEEMLDADVVLARHLVERADQRRDLERMSDSSAAIERRANQI